MIVEGFNANDIKPSNKVGLHPQLLYYDRQPLRRRQHRRQPDPDRGAHGQETYKWYAGDVHDQ